MSTRSVIARPVAIDPLPRPDAPVGAGFLDRLLGLRPRPRFQGVYHHNGGNLDELGPILWSLVRHRYGGDARKAWRELVADNPAGWSSLHCFQDEAVCRSWDGATKQTVAQRMDDLDAPATVPVSFQGDPQRDLGFRVPPIREFTDKMGAEWVYVLGLTELVVFEVGEDGVAVTERLRVPWAGDPPDWEALARGLWGDDDGDDDDG
jgi:hypothetical protein